MIKSSILVVNNVPEFSDGVTGGSVVSKRNEQLIKLVFDNVFVHNHIYKNKSKLRIFLQSIFGISCGLTKKAVKTIIKKAIENNCSYVFLGFSTIGTLAKEFKKYNITIITFFHNVEYKYLLEHIKNASSFVKIASIFLKRNVKKAENCAIKYSDFIFVLNERDSLELEKLYGRQSDYIIPITFNDYFDETKAIEKSKSIKNRIIFVGSDFFGNTEGLFWFIETCLDKIDCSLIVVGSGMDKYKNRYNSKNVEFKGFVEDLDEEYYDSDLVVLPILSGSGMKTKTCEALMYGKTIVATKEAFEGYTDEIFELKAGFLCVSSEEFVDTINFLLNGNLNKYNKASRDIFKNKYQTSSYVDKLEKLLLQNIK